MAVGWYWRIWRWRNLRFDLILDHGFSEVHVQYRRFTVSIVDYKPLRMEFHFTATVSPKHHLGVSAILFEDIRMLFHYLKGRLTELRK